MSGRKTLASDRRRRKTITFLWIAVLSIVTISLIYWEKTAILYILATLGVTVLLVVVALADLESTEKISADGAAPGDSAARSGIT